MSRKEIILSKLVDDDECEVGTHSDSKNKSHDKKKEKFFLKESDFYNAIKPVSENCGVAIRLVNNCEEKDSWIERLLVITECVSKENDDDNFGEIEQDDREEEENDN